MNLTDKQVCQIYESGIRAGATTALRLCGIPHHEQPPLIHQAVEPFDRDPIVRSLLLTQIEQLAAHTH